MYACVHVCMYACMHVCMYACMYARMHGWMYLCMHACMYVCMYVSKNHAHTHIHTHGQALTHAHILWHVATEFFYSPSLKNSHFKVTSDQIIRHVCLVPTTLFVCLNPALLHQSIKLLCALLDLHYLLNSLMLNLCYLAKLVVWVHHLWQPGTVPVLIPCSKFKLSLCLWHFSFSNDDPCVSTHATTHCSSFRSWFTVFVGRPPQNLQFKTFFQDA